MERKYTKMGTRLRQSKINKQIKIELLFWNVEYKSNFDVVLKVTFDSYFEIRKVEHPGLRHNHTVERGVVICRKPAPRD